jgi:hypothetical protein
VTLDETRFCLSIDRESIWHSSEDEALQMERKIVPTPKMKLKVICNPQGFHMIDALPKGNKFDARYSISHILSPLPEILALYQDHRRRLFVIHAGNARSHCAKTVT